MTPRHASWDLAGGAPEGGIAASSEWTSPRVGTLARGVRQRRAIGGEVEREVQ
jgi:hypothetical protein